MSLNVIISFYIWMFVTTRVLLAIVDYDSDDSQQIIFLLIFIVLL